MNVTLFYFNNNSKQRITSIRLHFFQNFFIVCNIRSAIYSKCLPKTWNKKISPTRGFEIIFKMESIRRFPGLSGMIILLLLSTYTNPGASPRRGVTLPNLFAVDNTRKGDLERKSTQWWSNDEITFSMLAHLVSPIFSVTLPLLK